MVTDKELQLNVWDDNPSATIFAVQGESMSRTIRVSFIDRDGIQDELSNAPVVPRYLNLEGFEARMYVLKSDGTKVFFDGKIIDATNGIAEFVLTAQALAAPRRADCEIYLTSDKITLKVVGLKLDIQPSDTEGAIESSDEYSSLNLIISEAHKAISDCEKASDAANKASDSAETQANYAKAQGDYAKAQGNYAKTQGDYAKEQGEKAEIGAGRAEASVSLAANAAANAQAMVNNYAGTAGPLYEDITLTGTTLETTAAAMPLKSFRLCGPLAAGKHVVEVHGKNWFNVNLSYTNNNAYSTVTRENDAVTVVTNSAPAGFYDIAFPNVIRVKPNTEYTLSVLLTIENTQGDTLRGDIRIGDNDNTLIKFLSGETKDGTYRKSTTFTTPASGRVRLALRYHNTGALALVAGVRVTWAEIMLSEGALAYTPYTGKWYDVTVDQRLAEGESIEVKNVMAVDGTNIILNSANAPMEATFAAAIPQIKAELEEIKLTGGVDITPDKIGAVPTTRKVNGKPLSADVSLSVGDLSPVKAQGYTPSLCVIGSSGGVETLTGLTYETRTGWHVRYGQLVLWGALLLVTGANASGNYSTAGGELAVTLPTTATVHGGETYNLLGGSTVTVGGGGDSGYLATLYAVRYLSNAAKFVRRLPDGALQWTRWEETRTSDPQQFYAQIQVSGWYFDNK